MRASALSASGGENGDGDFTESEIDLIAGGVSLQRQKLPEHVVNLADAWLLRASKSDRRALRARSSPVTK